MLTYTCIDLSLISVSLLLDIDGVLFFFLPLKLVTCSVISLAFGWFFLGDKGFFSFGLIVASSLSAEVLHTAKIRKDSSFTLSHESCLPYEDCIDSLMALF